MTDSGGNTWSTAADGIHASGTAKAGDVAFPVKLEDGSTVSVTLDMPPVTEKPPPIPPKPTSRFPGDVATGTLHWGCAFGNNSVPAAHEAAAGKPVGLRRTYFDLSASSIAKAIAICKVDVAAGRVPWISYKPNPYTWAQIGLVHPGLLGLPRHRRLLAGGRRQRRRQGALTVHALGSEVRHGRGGR
jgi:hypothetical protein